MIYNSPSCPLVKSSLEVVDIGVDLYTKHASKSTHCPLSSVRYPHFIDFTIINSCHLQLFRNCS